jgi:hypothetical protein
MAHFTQLNLGSKQSEKSATTPRKRAMMMEEKAVLFGALVNHLPHLGSRAPDHTRLLARIRQARSCR